MQSLALLALLALTFHLHFLAAPARGRSRWRSTRSATGLYWIPDPSTGNLVNNARCAKVHNSHGPLGYRPRWRPFNLQMPEEFWSTPRAPRGSFASAPDARRNRDAWPFLGGEVQMFLTFKSSKNVEKAFFVALRCAVWTPIEAQGDEDISSVGVVLTQQRGQPHVVASRNTIPSIDPLGRDVTPIVLGMTPGVPGTRVTGEASWDTRDFEDSPSEFRTRRFRDGVYVAENLKMWARTAAPDYEVLDFADVTRQQWRALLPTRWYNESQCTDFLDYETTEQTRPDQSPPLVALSGVFSGTNMCDLENSTWRVLHQIATEERASPNSYQQPLSIPEGVLLIAVPAVWEFLSAAALLLVRIARGKTRQVSRQQKLAWIGVEVATVVVALGQLSLLVRSSLDQLQWQPCWMGRWAAPQVLLEAGEPVAFLGNSSMQEVLNVRTDVVAVECTLDPGTDAKWAITIGTVVVFHMGLLALECTYFTVPRVQKAVDVSLSASATSIKRRLQRVRHIRMSLADDEDQSDTDNESENDDNYQGSGPDVYPPIPL